MPKAKIKVPNKLRRNVRVKIVEKKKATPKPKPKRYKLKKGQKVT